MKFIQKKSLITLTAFIITIFCFYNLSGYELKTITSADIRLEGKLNEFLENTKEFLRACKLIEEYANDQHYKVCKEEDNCYIPRQGANKWMNAFYNKVDSFAQKVPMNTYWIYHVIGSMNNNTLKYKGLVMDATLTHMSNTLKKAYKEITNQSRYYADVEAIVNQGKEKTESAFNTQINIIRQYKSSYGDTIDSICKLTEMCYFEKVDL